MIIKAAHGGGGRGMRVVKSAVELQQKLEEAQRESLTALVQMNVSLQFIERAKHISEF